MKSKTVDRLLKSTTKGIEVFVDSYAELLVRTGRILSREKIPEKELSSDVHKKPG